MKDFPEVKRVWDWCAGKWARSFGCVLMMVLAFWAGMEVKEKDIVDDCKFVGSFREGPHGYNCSARVR